MNKSLLIALFLFPTLLIGQLATWNFDGQNTTATLSPAIASASAALVGGKCRHLCQYRGLQLSSN